MRTLLYSFSGDAMAEYKLKAKDKLEETRLVAVRLPKSYVRLLDEIALADPERATVSTVIRRALREYFVKLGKLSGAKTQ